MGGEGFVSEEIKQSNADNDMDNAIGGVFNPKSYPAEFNTHILNHEQTDNSRIVRQIHGGRNCSAKERPHNNGTCFLGAFFKVEALADTCCDCHE